jgi:signal transduction histidine kinase
MTVEDRAVSLLAGQNHALELIARSAPLPEVLDFLTRLIESQAPSLLCSILLLEDGRLRCGAAPSLPSGWNRVVEGLAIGPKVGSCGTAAYTRAPVIVTDIAVDPLWDDVRDAALAYGLRACWSTPIFAAGGEVLGTFAIYYRRPTEPRPEHLCLVELATHIAGIAIERRRADEAIAAHARRLAETARHKDEFLALLAHELRNPLAAIVTALAVLRRRGDEASLERCCGVVDRQVGVLARIVEDLLDLSRVSRGTLVLRKERTTAAALVARAVEASRPLLDGRRHELRTSLPDSAIEIEVDPVRMAQVLCNLLNNAAKYTEPGGHLEVRAAREGGEVVFAVRDDGAGIPEEMLTRVFDLFVQAEGASARAPCGLGVGLTLVKRLVELHGGRVEAHSEGLGRGTEMLVHLPAPPIE